MANPIYQSIGEFFTPKQALAPLANAAGTRTSASLDRTGFQSLVLMCSLGAVTGAPTSLTYDCKIQDSADGTTFADFLPDAVTVAKITQAVAGAQLVEKNVNLAGARQFIRVVEVTAFVGGTSPALPAAVNLDLGGATSLPV